MTKQTKCECGGKVPLQAGRHECPNACGRSFKVSVGDAGAFRIVCYGKRSVPVEHRPESVGALMRGGR